MRQFNKPKNVEEGATDTGDASPTCFTCTKLNDTTFLIAEEDMWNEYPFIYVKVYASVLVVIDTGCGGASKKPAKLTSLREFLETWTITDNDGKPLNPGSEKGYVVICSHCHFDHIGAIEQFKDTPKSATWTSSYDKSFIEGEGRLPTSSLCRFVGMKTPEYKVTHWADDGQHVVYGEDDTNLGLVVYHTPGHTPDELAIWDPSERVIFVGDSMYEWAHIIFPLEGNISVYSATLGKLGDLVATWNAGRSTDSSKKVRIACGHTTSASDAETLIREVDQLLFHIAQEDIDPKDEGIVRDHKVISYERDDGKLSFLGPEKLFELFRSDKDAMDAIRKRHA